MAGRQTITTLLGALIGGLVAGCAVLAPLPQKSNVDQRLAIFPTASLPLKGKTVIYWNDQQIPFIEASNDDDLAFTLGLVHAHLRLGQMEVLRRTAYGRLAEMGGPFAVGADHALRVIDYSRGIDQLIRRMPVKTRTWLEAFARGINYYQSKVRPLPHEFGSMGLELEKWTVKDILTIGRLAGSDVNWLVYWRALKLRQRPDWPQLWARLLKAGGDGMTSFAQSSPDRALLENVIKGVSRSGSNSLAVAGRRSKTGGALIASDPHLGIQFPNFWLIAGMKSPSYHAVGLMVPGLPFIAVGRNRHIAWGGTNMRAASSDLFDLSGVPADKLTVRKERIKVRWWFDKTISVRISPHGPVLSDVPSFSWKGAPFALRWIGHESGDETTAMLKVARARNWTEFRAAFKSFAVSAQNMIYADNRGNIGQVMAVHLPIRGYRNPPDLILNPKDPKTQWKGLLDATKLPVSYNPKKGFLATSNNKPTGGRVIVGHFFSADDRVRRISDVLGRRAKIGIADLKALQRDVYMHSAVRLRDAVLRKVEGLKLTGDLDVVRDLDDKSRQVLQLLTTWDGHYRADSRGALAFELFYSDFLKRFTTRRYGEKGAPEIAGFSKIKEILAQDINAVDRRDVRTDIIAALKHAAGLIDKFKNWGDMHRLALRHPLAVLPVIGSKFRFGNFPVGGSTDTVMKTSHGTTDKKHLTLYGQNARHISDLSDMDRNYFVLVGGQDGWFRSSTALDQMEMWRRGAYVQVPLRLSTVRSIFRIRMELSAGR